MTFQRRRISELLKKNINKQAKEKKGGYLKKALINYKVIITLLGFPLSYIFGASLLWRYLEMQGLREDFSLLIPSNNLLLSFAFLGGFATLMLVLYVSYAPIMLKESINDKIKLDSKGKIYLMVLHSSAIFFPIFLLFSVSYFFKNNQYTFWLSLLIFPIMGFLYLCLLKGNPFKIGNIRQLFTNLGNLLKYTVLVGFFVFYNTLPLLIFITIIEKTLEESPSLLNEELAMYILVIIFLFYSVSIAFVSMQKKPNTFIAATIIIIIICSSFFVVGYSNVPLNLARIIGIGHLCTELTLKKTTIIPETLKELSNGAPSTLKNVYVLLHKNKDEYIVSTKYNSTDTAERIQYSDIKKRGFLKNCPEVDK